MDRSGHLDAWGWGAVGFLWLPNWEDWAGDRSDRPTLNFRNTQSSSHQLHRILVPVRQLQAQRSAEACLRSCSSLERRCSVEPWPSGSSSVLLLLLHSHWPLRFSAQQSEGSRIFVSEAIAWRVVLSVAQRPAEGPVFTFHPGLTGD